jgi:hypothetical protein
MHGGMIWEAPLPSGEGTGAGRSHCEMFKYRPSVSTPPHFSTPPLTPPLKGGETQVDLMEGESWVKAPCYSYLKSVFKMCECRRVRGLLHTANAHGGQLAECEPPGASNQARSGRVPQRRVFARGSPGTGPLRDSRRTGFWQVT